MIIALLLTIIAFIQTSIPHLNILLPAVLALNMFIINRNTLLTLFATGILNDLLNLQRTGQSSLLYLILALFLYFYRQKFKIKNPVTAVILAFAAIISINYLNHNLNFFYITVSMVFFTLYYIILSAFYRHNTKGIND